MKKKFKISVLGCRTNQYEGQAFRDQLLQMGYEEAKEGEEAELCIVNTCTVTQGADTSSRHEIRELIKKNKDAKVVVTGCLAERAPETIKSIPGVFQVIANKDKEQLLQIITGEEDLPEFRIQSFEGHTRAFVKVQDGCNSFCTYCIIPYVRGRSRSKSIEEVIVEVKDLISHGYKEVVLTGINIGDFDGGKEDKSATLADLFREVDKVEGLCRLRVSSIDPDEVDDTLMNALIHSKNGAPSMHIVLQSGSNIVLKRMNRKYTKQIFLNTIDNLRNADPRFTFTTDVIVGFPGETEVDHEETISLLKRVKFAKVHMFPYSKRERTKAALYPNQVPDDVIRRRKQEVLEVSEQIAFELRESFLGETFTVLVESENRGKTGFAFGHTENFLPVFIKDPLGKYRAQDLVKVTAQENTPEGLIGKEYYDN